MSDQQASTMPFEIIERKNKKRQHFRLNKSPAASSQNVITKPYPTQDHRNKLFQELNIAPLQ